VGEKVESPLVPLAARDQWGLGGVPEFANVPPSERIKHYRALADVARREAQKATGNLRQSYLLMAEGWDNLADAAPTNSKQAIGE
jgi:hypothetical protein